MDLSRSSRNPHLFLDKEKIAVFKIFHTFQAPARNSRDFLKYYFKAAES